MKKQLQLILSFGKFLGSINMLCEMNRNAVRMFLMEESHMLLFSFSIIA